MYVEHASANFVLIIRGQRRSGALQNVLHLCRREIGIGFKYQRDRASHLRRGKTGATRCRVIRQLRSTETLCIGSRQAFGAGDVSDSGTTKTNHVHAGRNQGRMKQSAGEISARRKTRKVAGSIRCANADDPGRNCIGIQRVQTRAGVAGGKNHIDATVS